MMSTSKGKNTPQINADLQIKSPRRKPRIGNWLKITLVLLAFAVFLVGGYFLARHYNLLNSGDVRLEKIRNEQLGIDEKAPDKSGSPDCRAAADDPRFLTIESVGIKQACIVQIGVLAPDESGSQQLDAPKNYHDIGWYNCQKNPVAENKCVKPTRPGDGDTAVATVMDGHSCSGNSCVFDNLANLKTGDQIIIELGSGEKITYTTKEIAVTKLADVDMAKAMRPIASDQEGLNLITCAGKWTAVDSQGVPTMDKRVVVYASRDDS